MPLTTYTAGEVLTAASLNANLSFAASSPAGGLTLISATTIGTAVTSVTVTGAFSATYDNYLITVNGGVASTLLYLNLVLGATATGYYAFDIYGVYTSNTVTGFATANGTRWATGVGTANNLDMQVILKNPFLAKTTGIISDNAIHATSGDNTSVMRGFLNDTTSYTAFTIGRNTGTLTGGTIRVYGFANSQDFMTYKIQIDDLVRNATADETAAIDAAHAEDEAQAEAKAAKALARQAVLDKLGLTADEAAALLGQFGNTGNADRLRNNTR